MSNSEQQLKNIIEAAIMAAGEPLSLDRIQSLFVDDSEPPSREAIKEVLQVIIEESSGRGVELKEIGSGYRFQAKQDYAHWVSRLWEEKPARYSRALLETLVLIAYKQPITRGEIEHVRGVAVSSNIIKTLQEREWVRVVGHRDVPGKPAIYATTRVFLDYFNLTSLEELPTLAEIRDLDKINAELDLQQQNTDAAKLAEGGGTALLPDEAVETDVIDDAVGDAPGDVVADTSLDNAEIEEPQIENAGELPVDSDLDDTDDSINAEALNREDIDSDDAESDEVDAGMPESDADPQTMPVSDADSESLDAIVANEATNHIIHDIANEDIDTAGDDDSELDINASRVDDDSADQVATELDDSPADYTMGDVEVADDMVETAQAVVMDQAIAEEGDGNEAGDIASQADTLDGDDETLITTSESAEDSADDVNIGSNSDLDKLYRSVNQTVLPAVSEQPDEHQDSIDPEDLSASKERTAELETVAEDADDDYSMSDNVDSGYRG